MPDKEKEKSTARSLTVEERELWHKVASTAVAWRKNGSDVPTLGSIPATQLKPGQPDRHRDAPLRPSSPKRAAKSIDRKTRRKLTRGSNSFDGLLDLHGMRQEEAHRALRRFLASAQSRGCAFVLIITGKGSAGSGMGGDPQKPGVLRSSVPFWLQSAELEPFVAAFGEATRRHGGEGALYVQIRKQKS